MIICKRCGKITPADDVHTCSPQVVVPPQQQLAMSEILKRFLCRFGFHDQNPETKVVEYMTIYLARFAVTRCSRCRRPLTWVDTGTNARYRDLDQFLEERYYG